MCSFDNLFHHRQKIKHQGKSLQGSIKQASLFLEQAHQLRRKQNKSRNAFSDGLNAQRYLWPRYFLERFHGLQQETSFDTKIRVKHVFFQILTILKIGKRDSDLHPRILVCTYRCLKSVENDKMLLLSHPKSRSFCRPKFSNVNA